MQSIIRTENFSNKSSRSTSRSIEDFSQVEEETGSIKPFVNNDAIFPVSKHIAKYFLCDPDTAKIHNNLVEKFRQTEDLELQGRQFGANFIHELGKQLLV